MSLLHVTDNRNHELAAVLKDLLHSDAVHASDVATAYLVIVDLTDSTYGI